MKAAWNRLDVPKNKRGELAARTGIPETNLSGMNTGRIPMTREMADRIVAAVPGLTVADLRPPSDRMERPEVGQRIKAAREAKLLSQIEFALVAGVSPSSVSRWERGFLPSARDLIRVSELLDLDLGDLAELSPNENGLLEALRAEVSELRAAVEEGGQNTVKALEALRRQVQALARQRGPADPPAKRSAAR